MFLGAFQLPANAATYDTAYTSWTSENASYGPDDGNYSVTSYDDSHCQCLTYFIYDSSDVSAIRSYYDNNSYFPGIDITNTSLQMDCRLQSSTLPNPHFDLDDDYNSVYFGYEESEVTCESPYSISSGSQYYYRADFYKIASPPSYNYASFELNTNESYWSGFWGEYQTQLYSNLGAGTLTVDLP
jgi:hypothetical protein